MFPDAGDERIREFPVRLLPGDTDNPQRRAASDRIRAARRRRNRRAMAGVVTERAALPSTENAAMKPPADAVNVLECRELRKRFGDLEAVRGVSFRIAEGETYGLLGPNGAGKTTTISMVCGLLDADAGEVVVAGAPMTTRSVREKAAIGYVPQELAIYPDLSARENLRFFARLYGLPSHVARERVDEVLRVIGLTDRARRAGEELLGRHAASSEHRHRPAASPAAAGARRADGRRRSAEPQRHPRERRGARSRGNGRALHDALHGGGRAALRPHRDHRPGRAEGRGTRAELVVARRRARPRAARGCGRPRSRGHALPRAAARADGDGAGRGHPANRRAGAEPAARAAADRRRGRCRRAGGRGRRARPGGGLPAPDRAKHCGTEQCRRRC